MEDVVLLDVDLELARRALVQVLVFDVGFLVQAEVHLLTQGLELLLNGV